MIIRAENKSNFTIMSNAVLLDETISDKARGVLVRLLCRPENWNLNIIHLVKTGKDGNTAIRSAIRELEKAGYIQKEVTRHENGRIIGTEYIIHESPVKSCQVFHRVVVGKQVDPGPEETTHAHQVLVDTETNTKEVQIKGTDITENHMMETVIKQTAPIINTDIKQILRETTTTTPAREAEPVPEPVICDHVLSLPSSSSPSNEIINLIPSQHRSPVVLSLVSKAIVDYPEREVKEAIAYAGANVRGGSMQFKAYLDKTLQNKWAEGYLDTMGSRDPFGIDLFGGGQLPNGFTTGSKRLDGNLAACLEFAALSKRGRATA